MVFSERSLYASHCSLSLFPLEKTGVFFHSPLDRFSPLQEQEGRFVRLPNTFPTGSSHLLHKVLDMQMNLSRIGPLAPHLNDGQRMNQQQGVKEPPQSIGRPENVAEQRGGPGVLVLAPPMRLLHMNQRAWDLTSHIDHGENGNDLSRTAKGLLPAPLLQLCAEIFRHLKERTEAKDWEQFEVRRILGTPERALMIHGFGVPGNRGQEQPRVVVVMEELGIQKEDGNQQAKERFQFTDREHTVVQCLAKGWTNKEISCELGIAMPTVKEHIRHIMEKTKSTTRTGVLAQIFRS